MCGEDYLTRKQRMSDDEILNHVFRSREILQRWEVGHRIQKLSPLVTRTRAIALTVGEALTEGEHSPHVGWFYSRSTFRKSRRRLYYRKSDFPGFDLSRAEDVGVCCDWLLDQGDDAALKKLRQVTRHLSTRTEPNDYQRGMVKMLEVFFGESTNKRNLRVDGTLRLVYVNAYFSDFVEAAKDYCTLHKLGWTHESADYRLNWTDSLQTLHKFEIVVPASGKDPEDSGKK